MPDMGQSEKEKQKEPRTDSVPWPVCLHCDGLYPGLKLHISASPHLYDPVTHTTSYNLCVERERVGGDKRGGETLEGNRHEGETEQESNNSAR